MKTLQDHYDSFLSMIDPTQLSNIVAYLKNPDSDIKAVMEVADRQLPIQYVAGSLAAFSDHELREKAAEQLTTWIQYHQLITYEERNWLDVLKLATKYSSQNVNCLYFPPYYIFKAI